MSRVSGQGAETIAESGIHKRFFGAGLIGTVVANQLIFLSLQTHYDPMGERHPRDLITTITTKSKDLGARSKQKECLKDSTSQHTLQLYLSQLKVCQTKKVSENALLPLANFRPVFSCF